MEAFKEFIWVLAEVDDAQKVTRKLLFNIAHVLELDTASTIFRLVVGQDCLSFLEARLGP